MAQNRAVFGPLAPLLDDPRVTDVFLNPDGAVWVDRGGGAVPEARIRVPPGEARELAVRLIASGGRHLDEAAPCADVRIGDGLRVHGVLPPVSPGAAVLSIRVPRSAPLLLDGLERDGFFERVPLSAVAERVLLAYDWPGNIRELENVIHYAVIVSQDGRIEREDLRLPYSPHDTPNPQPEDLMERLREVVKLLLQEARPNLYDAVEELVVTTAFSHCGENQVRTARDLGLSRNVLRGHLKRFGLLGQPFVVPED